MLNKTDSIILKFGEGEMGGGSGDSYSHQKPKKDDDSSSNLRIGTIPIKKQYFWFILILINQT